MPILDVEVVGAREEGLARRIADAAGAVFGPPAGRTWVKVRFLARRDYAEDGAGLPPDVRPVMIRILKADRPENLDAEVRALTVAVAAATGRPPENVHLLYEPWGRGRVAFGGNLVGGA